MKQRSKNTARERQDVNFVPHCITYKLGTGFPPMSYRALSCRRRGDSPFLTEIVTVRGIL